ncbi:hypothetical protein [Actinoplanes aureus]|uniref:Uncharacterized protein n=1 Tax=Actinoplanes aureus TaxID=2792083 RepID=A0A931G1Y8_9ACTN|nr:hypothetical protein [Actinoplanes aureus]MBG0568453.1 hypothetical protein [Actinoplanes aureus]
MQQLSQASFFTVAVRPARAVYLIAEGSRAGFRRAVQEATTRWGGACEPIVEVSADGSLAGLDTQIVETAGVDGAVNVDVSPDHARATADSLGLDLVPIDDIDRWGKTRYTTHPAALRLSPSTVDGSNGYLIPAADAALWQTAVAGDLTAGHLKDLDRNLLSARRTSFDNEIGEAQLRGQTLLGRTTVSAAEQWASPAPLDSPTIIWLTRSDSVADCVGFWNMRALRSLRFASMPMYLLPEDLSHWSTWPSALHQALRRPGRFTPDVLLMSATVEMEGLDAFASRMGLRRPTDSGIRRFPDGGGATTRTEPFTYLIHDPHALLLFRREYGENVLVDVPVVREQTTLRFASPVPLKAVFSGSKALARITGEPLDGLPRRACVATLVGTNAFWHNGDLQLAIGLRPELRLEFRIPTLAAAATAVLTERTRSHVPSAKGMLGLGLLSDEALEALAEPDVFEAIRQLTTPRGEEIARKLQKLFGKEQPLTFEQKEFAAQFAGRSERTFRSADRLGHGTPQAALAALERLVGIGWAERGFAITCAGCGLTSYLPLTSGSSAGPGRCPACQTGGDYARTDRGLVVNYRLDGRVDHANDQGVLAHLMVIGALKQRYKQTWLLPGIDMTFDDGTLREADVFGVCDGRMVSGEVKMSGASFTADQIEKDIAIAVRIKTDLYVMAATSPIPAEATDLAAARCADAGIELLVLQRDDLRRAEVE